MASRAWLATAVVLAAVVVGAQGPPAPAPIPAGSTLITGRVVDATTGSPIASAVVALAVAGTSGRASTERVLTDARGRFFFNGIGAGSFTLTASKPGWMDGAAGRKRPAGPSQPLEIRDGEHPAEIAIPLWRHGVISGRVLDEQDEAIVGTDVRIFQGGFAAGRRQWTFIGREITDDRGVYRASALMPGVYLVVVPTAVSAEPAALRGPAGLPTSYYQTMSPIGAAAMSFAAARIPASAESLVTSIFNLPASPAAGAPWLTYPTTYFPSATALGAAEAVDVVSGRERAGVDVVMRPVPTFTVSGSLTMPPEMAPGFHAVHLLPADSADRPLFDVATAVTDVTGGFTFYGVPPGQYIARIVRTPPPGEGQRFGTCGGTGAISYVCTVLEKPMTGPPPASTEPLLHADAPVTVTDRAVRGVALILRPGVRLTGRAEFESTARRPTPAEWRTIDVTIDPAGGQVFKAAGGFDLALGARFTEDGRVVLPSAWPGRYVVRVESAPPGWSVRSATVGGRDVLDTALALDQDVDDLVVTFTDRVTRLTGTVQGSSGQADRDAAVLLFPADPARWVDYGRSTRRLRVIQTSAGSFSTPVPPDGEYLLIALSEAQLADWQNPAFLKRAAALADRLTVRDGQPMTQVLRRKSLP